MSTKSEAKAEAEKAEAEKAEAEKTALEDQAKLEDEALVALKLEEEAALKTEAELTAKAEAELAAQVAAESESYGDPDDQVNEDQISEQPQGLAAKYPDGVPLHILNAISNGTYKG